MLSTAQTPTYIDICDGEFLNRVTELNDSYYAVGLLHFADDSRSGVVVKYKENENYSYEIISAPDSSMFFADIVAHNGRLFVTGGIGSIAEDHYSRCFIGEINENLELIWKKSYKYEESATDVIGSHILFNNDTLYVAGRFKTEGIHYGMVNSYTLQGDSLDHFWFANPYSEIDDMTHNLDSTGLLLVGKRFEQSGGYPMYAELSYDFESVSIDDIVSNYGRGIFSIKQETDSTYIMGCRLSETGFPGGVNGYTQHCLNRMDGEFNTLLLTTQGDFGENEDPAWNNSIDFRTKDTIFFAATHNGSFTYPPSNPSQLWVGYANNQLITQGIVKLGDENDYFNARDIIATSDGGCVVVGEHWNLSNEIAKMDLMIVKVEPEHFGPTPVSDISATSANVKIIPNPVKNKVKVILTDIPKTAVISVYNIHGQKMDSRRCTESEIVIPCKHWNNGIYFYSIINRGKGIATGKIVKD
ncbi:MAG: T9SS type A sorting domain-containing protein [Bacteroidota bacterium]